MVKVQAEHTVVGGQGELVHLVHDAGGDPLVTAAAERTRRAGMVGDALVGAAEHHDLEQLVEDEPVGDAGTVAAQRMRVVVFRKHRGDLVP